MPFMERDDAPSGIAKRISLVFSNAIVGFLDFFRCDSQLLRFQRDTVELFREAEQGAISAALHGGQDSFHTFFAGRPLKPRAGGDPLQRAREGLVVLRDDFHRGLVVAVTALRRRPAEPAVPSLPLFPTATRLRNASISFVSG